MKSNIKLRIRRVYQKLETKLGTQWTKKLGTALSLEIRKNSPTMFKVRQIIADLIKNKLEPKLAYIKQQETQYLEDLCEWENEMMEDENCDKPQPKSKYPLKEINTDNKSGKGFAGTALGLFPNVRETKIELGEECKWFKLFGMNKRKGTIVTMMSGPNKRRNRYLIRQYTRLFNSIDGRIIKKSHFNMTTKIQEHTSWVEWGTKLKDIHIKSRRNTHPLRKDWRKKSKKFWDIAFNLILNSICFRTVLMTSVLGKHKRWYHRDTHIGNLVYYNNSYCNIVKKLKNQLPIRRKWIPSGSKFRPLGIVPIAWRIYTKGLAQMLSVFLANSWASNQHGYTKRRGVQTAWHVILKKVISADTIFEYDLVGYFNNISHRCVVRQLDRFQVPKYVIMLLVELNCGKTKAPTTEEFLDSMGINESASEEMLQAKTFEEDWDKHEYLHKYRDSWRHRGFPQGGSLSPLISILPLILLEDLEKKDDTKSITYCDDGILYGQNLKDIQKILQELFDNGETGVVVHPEKSGWVKRNGKWESCLKFVGLKYDPFKDCLSAATRKGSTLPMQLDAVGLLSKEAKTQEYIARDESLTQDVMPDFSDCPVFSVHPKYLKIATEYSTNFDSIKEIIKWNEWHYLTILKWIWDSDYKTLPTITNRILRNDCGLWHYFRNIEQHDSNKAKELLAWLQSFYLLDDITWDEMWIIVKATIDDSRHAILGKGQNLDDDLSSQTEMSLDVDLLVWHKSMIRNNIRTLLENDIDLGLGDITPNQLRLFKLEPLNALANALPESMIHTAVKHNWNVTLYLSRLCWRNVVDSHYLGTLVSRLFIGSFSSTEKVKQNFKLEYVDCSLAQLGFSEHSNREWAKILHAEHGLTVFNSTTAYSFLLSELMELWDKTLKKSLNKHLSSNNIWSTIYSKFVDRLAKRRVGKFSLKTGRIGEIIPEVDHVFDDEFGLDTKGMQFNKPARAIIALPPSKKHIGAALLKAKRVFKTGVPIEAIAYSSASENLYKGLDMKNIDWRLQYKWNFKLLNQYRANCLKRPKRTDWFTWAPYKNSKRKSRPIDRTWKKISSVIE